VVEQWQNAVRASADEGSEAIEMIFARAGHHAARPAVLISSIQADR